MRRIAWLLITVGVVGLGWHGATAWAQGQSEAATVARTQAAFLNRAVAVTGGKETGALVHDYSEVSGRFQSQMQLEQLAVAVGRSLGMADAKRITRSAQGENFVQLSGTGAQQMQVSIYCSSFAGAQSKGSTVLVIRAQPQIGHASALATTLGEVYAAVTAQHMHPEVSAYIDTVQTGLMSHAQVMQVQAKVLAATGAKPIATMQSGMDRSVSAYAKRGPQAISAGGHEMNLQVAVHQDTFHDQTDVIVGTPIIVDPY